MKKMSLAAIIVLMLLLAAGCGGKNGTEQSNTPTEKAEGQTPTAVFPHRDEEDFAVSYDAYFETELYSGKGRRSKKKEASFLEQLRETIDRMAVENNATVLWDEPLTQERRG